MSHPIPGPRGTPLLGMGLALKADPMGFVLRMAREYGPLVYYRVGTVPCVQVNSPEFIQQVLVEQADRVNKSKYDKRVLNVALGHGLLVTDGEDHRRQRKLMQPVFHARYIENFYGIMLEEAARMVASWSDGGPLDVFDAMKAVTIRIVSRALYSAEMDQTGALGAAVETANRMSGIYFAQGYMPPRWLPLPAMSALRRSVRDIDRGLVPIIEARRSAHGASAPDAAHDLLGMLLAATDENGQHMTARQVRDEVVTLFSAGHETTSNALTWTWHLLAEHPEAEARLHEELDRVLGGRPPTLEDLSEMRTRLPYTEAVLKESMRVLPPVWFLNGRQPRATLLLGDYEVPAGWRVFISPYVVHRSPEHYDEPGAFRPDRWLGDLEKRLPRYAYMPFGGGPRICIGNGFALMEARLILALVASQFRLRAMPGKAVIPHPAVTLYPREGLPMILERRTSS